MNVYSSIQAYFPQKIENSTSIYKTGCSYLQQFLNLRVWNTTDTEDAVTGETQHQLVHMKWLNELNDSK